MIINKKQKKNRISKKENKKKVLHISQNTLITNKTLTKILTCELHKLIFDHLLKETNKNASKNNLKIKQQKNFPISRAQLQIIDNINN